MAKSRTYRQGVSRLIWWNRSRSFPIGFVATPIWFALLAAAEEEEAVTGRELLESFIIGYEVEVAIARGLGVHHWSKGWHSTSTLAHFGAAVELLL